LDRTPRDRAVGARPVRGDREPRRPPAQHRARFEQEALDAGRSIEAIEREITSWPRSGFDPTPSLERLAVPALWLFGGADRNVPARASAAALRRIEKRRGKNWTIVVFPGAGHGLLDDPPTDPHAAPLAEAWIRRHVAREQAPPR
jgi:pimeloyl-ACP methyl ester carboxylesterase